jgi:HEAT repeat protein
LKLGARFHPQANLEPSAVHDAQAHTAGDRIAAQASAGGAGNAFKPRAVPQVSADASEPTPRPGVVTDLPPEGIDLEEVSEDIGALTKVAFGDPDPERRLAAVTLLSATEDPQVITVLARSLADQNEEVRMAALQALSDFTGEAPAVAIESALHDPSPDIRYEAVSMLAEVGTDRARTAIRQALADSDDDVRFLAESVLEMDKADGGTPHEQPAAPEAPLR